MIDENTARLILGAPAVAVLGLIAASLVLRGRRQRAAKRESDALARSLERARIRSHPIVQPWAETMPVDARVERQRRAVARDRALFASQVRRPPEQSTSWVRPRAASSSDSADDGIGLAMMAQSFGDVASVSAAPSYPGLSSGGGGDYGGGGATGSWGDSGSGSSSSDSGSSGGDSGSSSGGGSDD